MASIQKAEIISADRQGDTMVKCPYCNTPKTYPTPKQGMDIIYKEKCESCNILFKVDVKGFIKQIKWL